ncbi:MFS transporter [Candidiatus Paracoxiella cheracis]|uniref:MFS transporter n=1 Tax=Candidiatus Paracoxiella cheracis TaxID=3405120 RepID=UPI003BF4EAF0
MDVEDQLLTTDEGIQPGKLLGQNIRLLAWTIFATGVLYYCFAYLLRVYPSVMEEQLRGYFHITAGGFGLLTAFYYFAYAPMQLPVGMSVDRIGPRRSLIFACLISTVGVVIFASFKNFHLALLGRFMVGFGAAFAYVTALKLASVWLPRQYFATATGLVTGFGMVAAIFTDIYLTHVVHFQGFKLALYFPLAVGVILFLLIILIVRDKPFKSTTKAAVADEEAHALNFRQLKDYLMIMIKNPQMWFIGVVGALLYMPSSVFLDVWAIPYLEQVHHLSPEDAALGVSVMLMGWICSSFFSCAISDVFGSRKIPLVIAAFGSTIISTIILFDHQLPFLALYILLFLFGLACGPHPLCFTLSKENNAHKISGTAVAFANFVIMMGGFIFQPVVGDILDWLWDGRMEHGIRVYSSTHYTMALSILPVGLFLAAILTLFIKETYQRSMAKA